MQDAGPCCFVCDRPGEETRPLLKLCECKDAHPDCKAGYRQLHRGSVHELFCTECRTVHATLPNHVATDAGRGKHHVALVELRIAGRKPVPCALLSSIEGREQLRTLARARTGWPGAWRLTAFCQVEASGEFAQIDGWGRWPWVVYCIEGTQARHGVGRHWVELVRDATENNSPNFSMV